MTKHTKGPWKAVAGQVKAVNSIGMMAKMTDYPEALADSKLMAAAPDLFYQLKTAIHLLKQCDEFRGGANIKLMEEAVNKAKGII